MSMLTDRVPDHLMITGIRYPIETSFRTWIQFEKLLTENESVQIAEIFGLIFKRLSPSYDQYEEAVDEILRFYQCGKEDRLSGGSQKEVFSYDYDDEYIISAFQEQYGIDLENTDMHWWKFHAYMLSLSPNTEFVKIMGYRAVEINAKMSAEQRNFYQKMKRIYKLPLWKEDQDRNNRLEEALLNGESIDGLL